MKPILTWVLVADGSRGRVLRDFPMKNTEIPRTQEHPEDLVFAAPHKQLHEIMADKPGRAFESSGSRRSSMEYHSDPVAQMEHAFAEDILEALEAHHREKAFSKLAIIAAPKMLSHIRKALPDSLKGTVVAEVAKDLTKLPANELREAVHDLLTK